MIEQTMTALVNLWLHTDLKEFERRFYEGMARGYILQKYRVFQANPIHWYNTLDAPTRRTVVEYLSRLIDNQEEV